MGLLTSEQMIMTWEHLGTFQLRNVHCYFQHVNILMFKIGKYAPVALFTGDILKSQYLSEHRFNSFNRFECHIDHVITENETKHANQATYMPKVSIQSQLINHLLGTNDVVQSIQSIFVFQGRQPGT